MKIMAWVLLICLALGLGGCALFGVHTGPDGTTIAEPGGGIVGTVAGWAGLPWVGTVIGGLAAAYANARRGKWKDAATSTFDAIEEAKTVPEVKKVWDKTIQPIVEKSHAAKKVTAMVEKALGNV